MDSLMRIEPLNISLELGALEQGGLLLCRVRLARSFAGTNNRFVCLFVCLLARLLWPSSRVVVSWCVFFHFAFPFRSHHTRLRLSEGRQMRAERGRNSHSHRAINCRESTAQGISFLVSHSDGRTLARKPLDSIGAVLCFLDNEKCVIRPSV